MESKLNEDALIQLVADNPGISRKDWQGLYGAIRVRAGENAAHMD
jgi:hypothetical protein